MASAIYNVSLIEIDAPGESPSKKYVHTIEIPKFLGWKRYSTSPTTETEIQKRETAKLFYFQSISPNTIIKPTKIESLVSVQKTIQHYTESSLIKKLEDLGIGRPSTFATIVESIQSRGYVKKQDIKGVTIKCNEYEIESDRLVKVVREKVFGNEKNKLVITPVGILTVEFLISHFNELFSYDYTKQMEDELDLICQGTNEYKKLCSPLSMTSLIGSYQIMKLI
jgi:DNA topoisomerase-1